MGTTEVLVANVMAYRWTNFHKQLAVLFVVTLLWITFTFLQYCWYYDNATMAAVNRLIRYEALLFEQNRLRRRQPDVIGGLDHPTTMFNTTDDGSTLKDLQRQSSLAMNDFFIRQRLKTRNLG
jgi:hypothetical protein